MIVSTDVGRHGEAGQKATPEMAIVFFSNKEKTEHGLVRHLIDDKGEFGVGELLSPSQALRELKLALPEEINGEQEIPLIPENLLMDTGGTLVWHIPRRQASIWFKRGKSERLWVEWPAMILAVKKESKEFFAYAVGTNRRPTSTTLVYKLPMFNIWSDGKVCQGTATIPAEITQHSAEPISRTLIDAIKTHTNDTDLFRPAVLKAFAATKSDTNTLYQYWKAKSASEGEQPQRVRMSELAPVGKLGELLTRLA